MITVAIIGAGPAGLSAAIHAAKTGAAVTLFERNTQCGAKLLATGGGRCNVTNLRPPGEWPTLFGRRGRFITPALDFLPLPDLQTWFEAMGQPLLPTDGFHLFPQSNSARAVRDALLREALHLGADIRTARRITEVHAESEKVSGISADGVVFPSERVIIATGGKSWPATGSTWDGCYMARDLGHRINPGFPGLVGLRAANLDADLAGLVLPQALALFRIKGKAELRGRGELLLTHGGASGPAILDISASVAEALEDASPVTLRLRWLEDKDGNFWMKQLEKWRKGRGTSAIVSLLREFFPQRLARWLCRHAGVDETVTAANVAAGQRDRLIMALAEFPLQVTGSEGWDKAMITRGGVEVRKVDPETLESRLVKGLYFAGETLDIDGPCGGYNLHWAFASGALVGASATNG